MDMGRKMPLQKLRRNQRAASPAVSAVIITAVSVVLVMVAGTYALQTLDRQKGASEFETVKKSIVSFDDSVRDIAWERDSSRYTRFTINYGFLKLMPSTIPLNIDVTDYDVSYSTTTGCLQYSLSTTYLTYGDQYLSYIAGNSSVISTDSTESLGRAYVSQVANWVNITLNYRVRAMKVYTVAVNQNGTIFDVSYVDIWIIKLNVNPFTYVRDLNLAARTTNVTTQTFGDIGSGYSVRNGQCTMRIQIGSESSTATIPLDGDRVVFNFIVSEVRVSG